MEQVNQVIEGLKSSLGGNKTLLLWLPICAAFFVAALIANAVRRKRIKAKGDAFLAEHPDAAILLRSARNGVVSDAVQVIAVNGAAPQEFVQGSKAGIYLLPGESTLEVRYTHTRPGVMYRTVTQTMDETIPVAAEPRKRYLLSYDRKAERFLFAEAP
jgi:hypothetical protein